MLAVRRILLVANRISNCSLQIFTEGVGVKLNPLPRTAIAPGGMSISTNTTTLPESIASFAASSYAFFPDDRVTP